MDIEKETAYIFDRITNAWAGSQMLFPINNIKGDRIFVTFYKDDSEDDIRTRLQLWYDFEQVMVPIYGETNKKAA